MNPLVTLPPDAVAARRSERLALRLLVAVLGVALLGACYAYFVTPSPEQAPRTVRRFSFTHAGLGTAKISPDGRFIAYSAQSEEVYSLWLRPIGS
jgi:hypothetical protein